MVKSSSFAGRQKKIRSPIGKHAGERQQKRGKTAAIQGKETAKLETVGDHVELVPDFAGQGSTSGKSAEGEDSGDQSVLDEVRSAFIVQEILEKLLRTVHVVSPL
jgi:hypothetical protein